jgi:tRNA threonylcarbamoyladenosine biosynthesis protein TsaE
MAGSKSFARKASRTFEFASTSVEATQALGERLGALLRAGDVVALRGELGSGKTTLVQGIARGAGVGSSAVKSPTFVLMREYGGPVPLIHIDGYRLSGAPQAAWLDVEMLFSSEKITLIEWAERLEGLLPADHLELDLSHVSTNRRRIGVRGSGARGAELAAALQTAAEQLQPEPAADDADETPAEGASDAPGD